MSTGLLEQRANYSSANFEYGYGSGGTTDADNDTRKEIDCSHLLHKMVQGAGYQIPYQTTTNLNSSTYYEVIAEENVQPGDVALWKTTVYNHTGVVESFTLATGKGTFFGSQSSTGPASARFGPGSGYWPTPTKFLRPKAQYRTITPAAAPAATPPAPAPVSAQTMAFQYPIRKPDGSQFKDAEELYQALEKEKSGHYLLGGHGFWHGGIHISDKSAPQCKVHEPVRCIADGEVVAYRLNKNYLASTYKGETLNYSSSFCLVRHRYESPKNQTEGPHKGKQNKLTLYSLYMHLLPYERYPVAPAEVSRQVRVKASDLRVRSEANLDAAVLGTIETGAELEILAVQADYQRPSDPASRYELAQARILKKHVRKGATNRAGRGDTIWLALSKQDASGARQLFTEDLSLPQRAQPGYWQGNTTGSVIKEVNARQAPVGEEAGAAIGPLAPTTVLEFDTSSIRSLKVGEQSSAMAECRLISGGLKGAGTLPATFWVCVESKFVQRKSVIPVQFDTVVTCEVPIKASDPIGFLGLYEIPAGLSGGRISKHQVHLEVFSNDPGLEKFLKNDAALTEGKQYLRIAKDKQLSNKSGTDLAPIFTPAGAPLQSDCVLELSKTTKLKDASEKEWFGVTVQNGGAAQTGFIGKADTEIITQHDWEKLGFMIVKEQNETADGFLDPEQMPPFFNALYKEIDQQGNSDGQVTPSELTAALRSPALRERWSRLIAYHPTEWQAKSDQPKWRRLKDLLRDAPELLKHEQERIDSLVFWDELAGVIQIAPPKQIYHFHPFSFIENCSTPKTESTIKEGQITFDAEGNDIPGSPYFSRVIHWPGNILSGVTLGRGYDMGSRSESEIYNHMITSGVDSTQGRMISKAHSLKGNDAKQFVTDNKEDIGEITHNQQIALFNLIYPDYVNRAIANYNSWTASETGRTEWSGLQQIIRDVLVDFVYQGFTKGPNPMKAGMTNDVDQLIRYIENTPAISQYEQGRHRANYLRNHR